MVGVAIGVTLTKVRFEAKSGSGNQSVQIGVHFGAPTVSRKNLKISFVKKPSDYVKNDLFVQLIFETLNMF